MPSNKPQYADLLIIDDILPSDFSPFRTLEYSHYLSFFDSVLLSLEGWHLWVGNETFEELAEASPLAASESGRIMPFAEAAEVAARLAYVTFLGNARRLLPFFKARSLPFILQLYPGGGFEINQPSTDQALRDVLLCELCRGVIVTQKITRDYIQDRIGIDPTKVTMVFGGVFDSRVQFDFTRDKIFYQKGKDTLDLCFVAHKYAGDLSSKGYDQFVAIARALAPQIPQLHFHVVGDYLPSDIALNEAADRFTFYGRQPNGFFAEFYPRMDAIVSVNRPFVLAPGAFDGFPTGACIEAGFRGVLNCVNDPLALNPTFAHDRDIILLDYDTERSIVLLRDLLANPQHLYEVAYANWCKFHVVFDVDAQLWARSRVIVAELARIPQFITTIPQGALELDAALSRAAAEAQLSKTVAAYKALQDTYLQLEAGYRNLEAHSRELEAHSRELEAHCRELEATSRDVEARHRSLEENYQAILRSSSWRMTRPLRVLLDRNPTTARLLRRSARLA